MEKGEEPQNTGKIDFGVILLSFYKRENYKN